MTKLPSFLIFFAISSSVMANPKYMRREDLTAAFEPEDRILTAGIASSGVISKLSEQREAEARVASSLVAFKKSYADAHKLLEQARLADVYDQDGFEVEQVPLDARLKSMEEAKDRESVDLLAIEKDEIERSAAHQKVLLQGGMDSQLLGSKEQDDAANKRAATYSGTKAVISGFWAKDRPFQERIDPDNMKIYTFKTYRHRFPFVHSWEVEVMWKKLPMAPRMVHKVRRAQVPSATDTSVLLDSQLESGMTLVDENQQELVWTKDYNGYYHMGREAPTEDDIFNIAHQGELENKKFEKKETDKEELYGLYHDYSDDLQQLGNKIVSSKMVDREDAARRLEDMLADMQHTLKMQPSRSGKAFISVRGAEGDLCSFNADIAKVTGMAMKRRIEKATGIPWEAQMLFIKGKELEDTKLLNENVGGGNGAWIDLQQRGWEITNAALIKRGKLAQPMAPPQKTETVLAQVGIESHVASNFAVGARAPKPGEVREFASDVAEDKEVSAQQAEDEVDDYNDADHGLTDDHEDVKPDQMMDEKQKQKAAEEVYQVEAQKTAEEYSQKVEQKAQQDAEAANTAEPLVASAAQKDIVTREVVYVRGESGGWHVEKEEVATPTHPIPDQVSFDTGADEGIPVQERLSDGNAKAIPAEELLQGPTHHRFDKKAFMKEQKHALSEEMKWRSQEKLNDEKSLRDQAASTPPPLTVPEKGSVGVQNAPESFLQIGILPSPVAPATASLTASVVGDAKEMRDQALAEATRARTLYVLDRKSKATLDIENADAESISKAEQWREAANPIEKYEGAVDPMSMSEMSKRRTQQDKAYDGLQAVSSGFWPEDRPDERRVDITDSKIYTWRQYRLKYPFKHSWEVEDMWKQLPTQQRVKKLGKLAFIQRFR